jgi:hypothetical protein
MHLPLLVDFGIIIALWIFFVFVTCVGTERLPAAGSASSSFLYLVVSSASPVS